ncbi:MAG: dihydroneopterin aldolase [Chitinophagaceae bacterium]
MLSIHLHHLRFFSYHGLFEEEKILGNEFEVNVDVCFHTSEKITALNQTINYASVYEIVQQRMRVPTPLLETLAQEMTDTIRTLDDRIVSIRLQINKLYPPLKQLEGQLGVSWFQEY